MSQIRGVDTKPELIVRSVLHKMGYRFRLHRRDLPGKPDIVLPKYRTVVFVHGCFWHRHKDCKYAYMPKSRAHFWENKFEENVDRDRRVKKQLKGEGWCIIIVWQCQTGNATRLATRLDRLLCRR